MGESSNLLIPVGMPIVYYNERTGFATRIFRGHFKLFNPHEIKKLKSGDTAFVDKGSLHDKSKVYGRVKIKITEVQPLKENELKIYYTDGVFSGYKITHGGFCPSIQKVANEQALIELINKFPAAVII